MPIVERHWSTLPMSTPLFVPVTPLRQPTTTHHLADDKYHPLLVVAKDRRRPIMIIIPFNGLWVFPCMIFNLRIGPLPLPMRRRLPVPPEMTKMKMKFIPVKVTATAIVVFPERKYERMNKILEYTPMNGLAGLEYSSVADVPKLIDNWEPM